MKVVFLSLFREGFGGKVFVIPNGRDLQRYAQCRIADIGLTRKTLTFVGHISPRKNQVFLLEVLSVLPRSYRLQLVGKPLNPDYGKRLQHLCDQYGLDNVVFTGQVPQTEIPSYLEDTHVFVSASRMEVQSLVVIEALASGTPVVGLSNETIDELVDAEVGCWLPADADPGAFARCIERICALSRPEYARVCAKARDRVREFDWSHVVAQTVEAYEELIEERPPITHRGGARLANLVSFLPSGEVRDILAGRVRVLQQAIERTGDLRIVNALPEKVRAVGRVSRSTWLLAGATVLISLVGYLVMKSLTAIPHVKGRGSMRREGGF